MKNVMLLFAFILCTNFAIAQDKKITKTGKIVFEGSVPSFEEIKAENNSVTCILNTKTGEIASLALVKGFRFKVALMEEHFNENYIESSKYPKATYKGKIQGFDVAALTATAKEYKMVGTMELHGKSKQITTTAMIRKVGDGIEIVSNFILNTDDYAIDIPKVVSKKVSKTISVKTVFLVK
ncbi:MAG: YceI family protein [Bacteroidota bacterium]